MDSLQELRHMVQNSANIVFFGGVSKESDIPDFRGAGGLYQQPGQAAVPPEVLLSHSYFEEHPREFFAFYFAKMIFAAARPNKAHLALAELERQGKLKAVLTQNIDGLHQQAGSRRVLELHGSVRRNYCLNCGARYGLDFMLSERQGVPHCLDCGGIVRPDLVLYEEAPLMTGCLRRRAAPWKAPIC
jgi:NAD-dependent deacetylase